MMKFRVSNQDAKVLYELANSRGMTCPDLARELNIPTPSVNRSLHTLKELRMVYKDRAWHFLKRRPE